MLNRSYVGGNQCLVRYKNQLTLPVPVNLAGTPLSFLFTYSGDTWYPFGYGHRFKVWTSFKRFSWWFSVSHCFSVFTWGSMCLFVLLKYLLEIRQARKLTITRFIQIHMDSNGVQSKHSQQEAISHCYKYSENQNFKNLKITESYFQFQSLNSATITFMLIIGMSLIISMPTARDAWDFVYFSILFLLKSIDR